MSRRQLHLRRAIDHSGIRNILVDSPSSSPTLVGGTTADKNRHVTLPAQRTLQLPQDGDEHEALFEAGLTDGLPVVAPTPARVERMLDGGPWSAEAVLLHEPARDLEVSAHQAAVCAVLAGAAPSSFRVIGAAIEALGDPEFALHVPLTSTGGAACMVIVSGPAADEIGVHGREGLFGPGFRPNATIGRTIRLVMLHCLQATPGQLDRSTQGWPGKFTLCFTENTAASPWEPVNLASGHLRADSTVTVFACESGHNIVNHAAAGAQPLLLTVADAMSALGSFSPGRSVVVLAPEHVAKLGSASRAEIQRFLYDNSARDLATLKRAGKIERVPDAEAHWSSRWLPYGNPDPQPGDEDITVRRGWGPDDILILVGGGAAGGHSMFFPSWLCGRGVPFITRNVSA